jgi:glycogen debranching enzyme
VVYRTMFCAAGILAAALGLSQLARGGRDGFADAPVLPGQTEQMKVETGPFPTVQFRNPAVQAAIGVPFENAVKNLLTINVVPYDSDTYNRTGLLRGGVFIRAGGGYSQPWTRDAAINSWNAASLLAPDIARNTLWAATKLDESGEPIVQRDSQWWDKVIWIVGAWNHYLVTGDRPFLSAAYGVSARLLKEMRTSRYDEEFGLFRGPSFFNDGIAGYPSPPADPQDGGSSFVLDHPGTDRIMTLSTNCLYVGAYTAAEAMSRELGDEDAEWGRLAKQLKDSINRRLWTPSRKTYGYFLDGAGHVDGSQEGAGLALAVLFGVARPNEWKGLIESAHIEPFGVTDVYPAFPRYSDDRPGRHNAIVWPMILGMWSRAAVHAGLLDVFQRQVSLLATLSKGSDGHFFEIYNARTGAVDGGWQNNHHWDSAPDQTWSATAYISMITDGLFGLRFAPDGLYFSPMVPPGWGDVTLAGVHYRQGTFTIHLSGKQSSSWRVSVDGKPLRRGAPVPTNLVGDHRIDVVGR